MVVNEDFEADRIQWGGVGIKKALRGRGTAEVLSDKFRIMGHKGEDGNIS